MLNLSSVDPGYFGKGIYFTQHPKYGEYYAQSCRERENGTFQLLLCWVLIGKPFPVTKVVNFHLLPFAIVNSPSILYNNFPLINIVLSFKLDLHVKVVIPPILQLSQKKRLLLRYANQTMTMKLCEG